MAKKKSKSKVSKENTKVEVTHILEKEEIYHPDYHNQPLSERMKDEKILYAFLATFLSIVGFVIAVVARRDDKYVMYYAKHSLVIFIMGAIAGAISYLIGWIYIIGWIIKFALFIVIFGIWLLSWLYALEGEEKAIPIVTSWSKKLDL